MERERERRKRERERERERERRTDTNFFFFFPLSKPLSRGIDIFARTNSRRRTSRNTSPTHPKLVEALTMHTRALARNIIAVGGRERPNDSSKRCETRNHFGNTGGSIFKFSGLGCEKKRHRERNQTRTAVQKFPRGVVSSYKRKEKWTTKRVKRTKPLGARALGMGILILVLITAR